jgi:hypothetical protein
MGGSWSRPRRAHRSPRLAAITGGVPTHLTWALGFVVVAFGLVLPTVTGMVRDEIAAHRPAAGLGTTARDAGPPVDRNYYRTLITVADDCPVDESVVPTPRGERKTVAVLQYEMLADAPYELTQEDVLFGTWLRRQGDPDLTPAEIRTLREEFLAKPQPCLRTSPLAKRYGWGFAFDEDGRVALCAMESEEYRDLLERDDVEVLKAMRSRRA